MVLTEPHTDHRIGASRRVRPGNKQVRRDVIEAVRHIESVVTVWDQLGPGDDHLHTATS